LGLLGWDLVRLPPPRGLSSRLVPLGDLLGVAATFLGLAGASVLLAVVGLFFRSLSLRLVQGTRGQSGLEGLLN
jgi:hypothetical protein